MRTKALFRVDTHIAEAGRAVFAGELATVRIYQALLSHDADETAVHETRKAIRRTFTAFKLFAPYFEPGTLDGHRRHLKKLMRRLGRCRDLAVSRSKLAAYADDHDPLPELADYWLAQQAQYDEELRRYLAKPKTAAYLDAYEQFTRSPGVGVRQEPTSLVPNRVKQLAPILIYERVAAVRAYEDLVAEATINQLHQLRIQFKELRYTLHFFAPLMGAGIIPVETTLEALQDVLGDLNDARVALRLLAVSSVEPEVVVTYQQAKEREIGQLRAELPKLWSDFDAPKWRRQLATSMAVL